tara:strand:+ start:68 stop:568 length:501 start_codon:yes stop_codon:yes gene_type:complete
LNYFDIIVYSVLAIGFVRGFYKGFFNELASFLGFFIGLIGAIYFSEKCSKLILQILELDLRVLNLISFFILFFSISIVFVLIGKSMTKLVKFASLGIINRIFGGIFRALKFTILILIVVFVINYFNNIYSIEFLSFFDLESSISFIYLETLSQTILFIFKNEMMFI